MFEIKGYFKDNDYIANEVNWRTVDVIGVMNCGNCNWRRRVSIMPHLCGFSTQSGLATDSLHICDNYFPEEDFVWVDSESVNCQDCE